MLRLMIIIIDYLETTLFQSRYAKIDSNYHRILYPMIIITHAKAGSSKKAPCPAAHPQYSQVWKCPLPATIHSRLWGLLETDNDLDMDVLPSQALNINNIKEKESRDKDYSPITMILSPG